MPPQEKISNAAGEKSPNSELLAAVQEHADCSDLGACLQCHSGYVNQAFVSENGE